MDLPPESLEPDAFERYRQMRESAAVCELQPGMYAVTRYEDVRAVLSDPQTFSAVVGGNNAFATFGPTPVQPEIDEIMRVYPEAPVLMRIDPPDHTRVRNLVNRALTPAEVEKIKPQIQTLIEALTAPWIGVGRVEFVGAFASQLPSAVTTHFLGAAPQMQAEFRFWAGEVMSRFDGPQPPQRQLEVARNIADMGRYFLKEITERRRTPNGDLISLLAHAEIDGERLEDVAIVNVIETFLIGGHETTTFLLGESLHRLAGDPVLAERLRGEPALIPAFVEEILRLHSPAQVVLRAPTREVDIGGCTVPAGAMLVVALAAANRDPAAFSNPDALELARPAARRHVAFGHGAHACLGLVLARTEVRLALEHLLPRMSNIVLMETDAALDRLENMLLRGPTRLELRFEPRAADAPYPQTGSRADAIH